MILERPSKADSPAGGTVSLGAGVAAAGRETASPPAAESAPAVWSDYRELTKPRIVTMILIVTTLSALFYAGRELSLTTLLHLLLGTGLVAGSAGVLNQVLERAVDSRMARTRRRPVPAGRVSRLHATLFGLGLVISGTAYLALAVDWLPAALGLATWGLYVAIYTPLKTRSEWNTTVGAIAGALPMQMGYTAAGGSLGDWEGWALFGVLFLWQYPHFMAIAWMHRRDYRAAGLQMTPVVEASGRRAGRQAVLGSLLLLLVLGLLPRPWLLSTGQWAGVVCAVAAILVTIPFVRASFRFAGRPDDTMARRLLRASIIQLPAALLVLVISALV